MEEDFYASIKLKTGEEIFARVVPVSENKNLNLILTNPIKIEPFVGKRGSQGYKVEPWMKTTSEDMFLINMNDVITMTENNDEEMILMHQSYVRKISNFKKMGTDVSKKMGYVSSVSEAKKLLEKIYKNS